MKGVTYMYILWISMWFAAGFLTVGAIRYFKEKREIEKAITEQLMLHAAICEKTPTEINALCMTLGMNQAYENILTDYKIKHGYKTKD